MERSNGGVGFGQLDGAQKAERNSGVVGRLRDAEIPAFAHLSKSGADGGLLGWAAGTIHLRVAVEHLLDARHSQFLDVS